MSKNESTEKKSIGTLTAGEKGIISKIRGAAALHRYLYGLGIVAGTAVTRIRNVAPSVIGNPIPFRVRDKIVYLTEEISRCIQVAVCEKEYDKIGPEVNDKPGNVRIFYPLEPGRAAVNPVNV